MHYDNDNVLQNLFKDFEAKPSSKLWKKIDKRLSAIETKEKTYFFLKLKEIIYAQYNQAYKLAAAILLLIIILSYLFVFNINNNDNNRHHNNREKMTLNKNNYHTKYAINKAYNKAILKLQDNIYDSINHNNSYKEISIINYKNNYNYNYNYNENNLTVAYKNKINEKSQYIAKTELSNNNHLDTITKNISNNDIEQNLLTASAITNNLINYSGGNLTENNKNLNINNYCNQTNNSSKNITKENFSKGQIKSQDTIVNKIIENYIIQNKQIIKETFGIDTSNCQELKLSNNLCSQTLVFPNIFTPNNDGINDCFVILGIDNCFSNKLIVYDRNGKNVYEAINYQNNWDGKYLADGVYYFTFICQTRSEQISKNGVITIIRQ